MKIAQWSSTIATHIKSIDSNHLIMEGGGDRKLILKDPNIDIISEHYYAYWNKIAGRSTDLAALNRASKAEASAYGKVLIADEFGMSETPLLFSLIDEVIRNGTSGVLLWSLRPHRRDGGFYQHQENDTVYHSFHWPGFVDHSEMDEQTILETLRSKAYTIRGLPEPGTDPLVGRPALQKIDHPTQFIWRGVTGAASYSIERSQTAEGPWNQIAHSLIDSGPERNFFSDTDVRPGITYYYRVLAHNKQGVSQYSNVQSLSLELPGMSGPKAE